MKRIITLLLLVVFFSETEGRNTLAGGTSRVGWAGLARVTGSWFDVSANGSLVRATFDDTHLLIPYVPDVVDRGDLALFSELPWKPWDETVRVSAGLGGSAVGRRALPYGERSDTIAVLDAGAKASVRFAELAISSTNLLDRKYRQAEYNFASDFRSAGYPTLVAARHFAAGEPCAVFATLTLRLNFLQHIRTILKSTGQAAVVLPDNVLFEGGAGETVRRKLHQSTDLHTILRLPTGIFYAQGVKANVMFFDNKPAAKEPWTKDVWIYDYRSNIKHRVKKNQMKFEDLQDFIKCYKSDDRSKRKATWSEKNPEGRWRKFSYDEIVARDKCSLDITWLKDDSQIDLDSLPEPKEIAAEIVAALRFVTEKFKKVLLELK